MFWPDPDPKFFWIQILIIFWYFVFFVWSIFGCFDRFQFLEFWSGNGSLSNLDPGVLVGTRSWCFGRIQILMFWQDPDPTVLIRSGYCFWKGSEPDPGVSVGFRSWLFGRIQILISCYDRILIWLFWTVSDTVFGKAGIRIQIISFRFGGGPSNQIEVQKLFQIFVY